MRKVLAVSILAGFALLLNGCRAPATRDAGEPLRPGPAVSSAPGATASAGLGAGDSKKADDPRPVLVCFGDSLTAGFGTDPGQSYPDYLQTDLNTLHYRYRVDNEGVSGNTTKDGVERLPEIVALHPAAAVVEFGGNDGLRGLPIEDTRANLEEIVSTLQHAGINVALAGITLPPDYGPDYIQQFNQTYTAVAQKHHVPMLPFLLKNVYGVPGMMQADETHATAKGNQIVARNVLPLVTPLLKK